MIQVWIFFFIFILVSFSFSSETRRKQVAVYEKWFKVGATTNKRRKTNEPEQIQDTMTCDIHSSSSSMSLIHRNIIITRYLKVNIQQLLLLTTLLLAAAHIAKIKAPTTKNAKGEEKNYVIIRRKKHKT